MKKNLTVCLGNICRSPAAEGILRAKLIEEGYVEGEDFHVESAGTGPWHVGGSPDPRSIAVCAKHQIDISRHKGRRLEQGDGAYYDLILGMDQSNIDNIKSIIPQKYHKNVKFFADQEVGDPYFGEMGFETMYDVLEKASEKWISTV